MKNISLDQAIKVLLVIPQSIQELM